MHTLQFAPHQARSLTGAPYVAEHCGVGDKDSPSRADDDGQGPPKPDYNRDGVDMSQIRALKALTPTERVELLVQTLRKLAHIRDNVRPV